jgi:hypothetical protein
VLDCVKLVELIEIIQRAVTESNVEIFVVVRAATDFVGQLQLHLRQHELLDVLPAGEV